MKKFYIYGHYRPNEDRPFYIGKGCGNRYKLKHGRIDWWHRIVEKHFPDTHQPIVRFFAEDIESHDLALDLEKFWIALFGRQGIDVGGCLINQTAGGDGIVGFKHKEATIKKMSVSAKARGGFPKFDRTGFKDSAETKQKRALAWLGSKNPNFGKSFSQEHRDRLSQSHGAKLVYLQSPTGQIVPVTNQAAFATTHNLHKSLLCRVINRKAPSCAGWTLVEETN